MEEDFYTPDPNEYLDDPFAPPDEEFIIPSDQDFQPFDGPLPIPEDEPVEEKFYTVTLADGTELTGLRLNGNNFISDVPVTKEQFEFNCSPVTISDGTVTETHENMELSALQVIDGEWYFVLLDIPEQELWKRKVTADMQYLSMMTEVELD